MMMRNRLARTTLRLQKRCLMSGTNTISSQDTPSRDWTPWQLEDISKNTLNTISMEFERFANAEPLLLPWGFLTQEKVMENVATHPAYKANGLSENARELLIEHTQGEQTLERLAKNAYLFCVGNFNKRQSKWDVVVSPTLQEVFSEVCDAYTNTRVKPDVSVERADVKLVNMWMEDGPAETPLKKLLNFDVSEKMHDFCTAVLGSAVTEQLLGESPMRAVAAFQVNSLEAFNITEEYWSTRQHLENATHYIVMEASMVPGQKIPTDSWQVRNINNVCVDCEGKPIQM